MAASTLFSFIPDDIKCRWREPYITAGIARKDLGVVPRGIYRGWKLIAHPSTNGSVRLQADTTWGDSVANCISEDVATEKNYAITLRQNADLDVSLSALGGQTVYLALVPAYIVGADTTATIKAYPAADWAALSDADRRLLVCVGCATVASPAASAPVVVQPSGLDNDRDDAWLHRSIGDAPWSPAISNGGFERATTGTNLTRNQLPSWTVSGADAVAAWRVDETQHNSGVRALMLNVIDKTAGTVEHKAHQYVQADVVPGQAFRFEGYARLVDVSKRTGINLEVEFLDKNGGSSVVVQYLLPSTIANNTWTKFHIQGVVPASKYQIGRVGLNLTGITAAANGSFAWFDDLQFWTEPATAKTAGLRERRQAISTSLARFFDVGDGGDLHSASSMDAIIQFLAAGQGGVTTPVFDLRRGDGDLTAEPVGLRTGGTVVAGDQLLATAAQNNRPRFKADYSASGAGTYTLLLESKRGAGTTYSPARLYVAGFGLFVVTNNALFDNTTLRWTADEPALPSSMMFLGSGFISLTQVAGAAPWLDSGWNSAGSPNSVLRIPDGIVDFKITTGDGNLAPTVLQRNKLTAKMVPKAWATVSSVATTPVLKDGQNVVTAIYLTVGGKKRLGLPMTFAFADPTTAAVFVSVSGNQSGTNIHYRAFCGDNAGSTGGTGNGLYLWVTAYDATDALVDIDAGTVLMSVIAYGAWT